MPRPDHQHERSHSRFNGLHGRYGSGRSGAIVLWRLRGSLDELACAVRTTSYGFTLGLELAGEPILLELQANAEVLVDKAARLEAWLLTQGWEHVPDEQAWRVQ